MTKLCIYCGFPVTKEQLVDGAAIEMAGGLAHDECSQDSLQEEYDKLVHKGDELLTWINKEFEKESES